ncbi:MAG TPA: adenylate/guanylate cyclase domain-containing protein [Candidatus Baltobacteraceae bacterium]|nr:adenylate/guanylate cyclase domain-containing protein [Candidatus Baltobacteraceae bacterium]
MARQAAPVGRPSGTVTFLFSDIEGSSERWESLPDEMPVALARHDALLRSAIESHGGYVFKTVGDAFCAAFTSASDAVGAALSAQRALASGDFSAVGGIRVRMALHTGTPHERDGDYFGAAVNRVARLLALGYGGQVLISAACSALMSGESRSSPCDVRDLGVHRLKDLAQPEHVYQLAAADLQDDFPPLHSLDQSLSNLPEQLSSFVGREGVIGEIKDLLEKHRLVSLVGSGGVGKTRCAIQAGSELLSDSTDGVWFIDLAPISDDSLVASAVARAVGVAASPSRPALDAVIEFLKRRHLLLIIDNCEHVIEEARRVTAAILRAAPRVRILATSRESLNISGERIFRVPSLSLQPALQLFADRALSVDSRFAPTDEDAPHEIEICRRLDGIPLAIELAAARIRILSPRQIAEKLDERFRVLTGGDRSALPRHQTMRALIDWSYDLLSEQERAIFRKLSIFAGGFVLETALSVCRDGVADEIAMLNVLSSFVDRSLLQAERVGDTTRYRLLESVRQYARERLVENGEYDAAARAHAGALLDLAVKLEDVWDATPDEAWEEFAQAEIENWRAALEWTLVKGGDADLGRRLASETRRIWGAFAPAEGKRWVHAAREKIDASTSEETLALLDLAEARVDEMLNQHKASGDAAQRALDRFVRIEHQRGILGAQSLAGRGLLIAGRVQDGEALLHSALSSAEALGLRKAVCTVLAHLALARFFARDVAGTRELYAKALSHAREIGAEREAEAMLGNLAENEFLSGDAESAVHLAEEALAGSRLRNVSTRAITLVNLSAYLVATASWDEARERGREGLKLQRELQDGVAIAAVLQHLAAVVALQAAGYGDATRCARILGHVDARFAALGASRQFTEQQEYDKMLPALRELLGEAKCAALMREGSAWDEDRAVSEAMLL